LLISQFRFARDDHGIMPHSNSLLAMGAATRSMNMARICASLRRNRIASSSRCDRGCPLCRHNCSQDEFWYFCTTLLAASSNNGYCCALAGRRTTLEKVLELTGKVVFSCLHFQAVRTSPGPAADRIESRNENFADGRSEAPFSNRPIPLTSLK
jgi:hypothetical protein